MSTYGSEYLCLASYREPCILGRFPLYSAPSLDIVYCWLVSASTRNFQYTTVDRVPESHVRPKLVLSNSKSANQCLDMGYFATSWRIPEIPMSCRLHAATFGQQMKLLAAHLELKLCGRRRAMELVALRRPQDPSRDCRRLAIGTG